MGMKINVEKIKSVVLGINEYEAVMFGKIDQVDCVLD